MLASAPLAAAADSVRASVATVGKAASAALRSSGGPGSAGWLQPPSAAPHYLSNPCFRIALRTRLDLDIPCQTGTCQHRRPDGTLCGTPLDLKGKHARACKVGGWIVRKHNAVVAELKKWCEKHGCYVDLEALIPQANPNHPEARIDLIVYFPGHAPIYIDVTIVSAQSQEAIQKGSGSRDGVACEIAAKRKTAKYPHITVTPL